MATTDVATGSITYEDLVDAYNKMKVNYYTTSVLGTYGGFNPRAGAIGEPRRIIRSVPKKTPVKSPEPVKAPQPEKVPAKVELEQ